MAEQNAKREQGLTVKGLIVKAGKKVRLTVDSTDKALSENLYKSLASWLVALHISHDSKLAKDRKVTVNKYLADLKKVDKQLESDVQDIILETLQQIADLTGEANREQAKKEKQEQAKAKQESAKAKAERAKKQEQAKAKAKAEREAKKKAARESWDAIKKFNIEFAKQQTIAQQRGLAESVGEWAFYAAAVLMILALIK